MRRPTLSISGTALAVSVLVTGLLVPAAAAAAPPAPTGLSPSGGSVSENPTLSWNRVRGGTRYQVQVSATSDFGEVGYAVTTYNRRATPTEQLPSGTVFWRVRGISANSENGPWARAQFSRPTRPGPTPQSPADGATLSFPADPPLFTWSPVPGATQYEVQVDDDRDFIGATTENTETTSLVYPDAQLPTEWFWHVRAVRGNGLYTQWSPTRSYTIEGLPAPVLTGPPDGLSPTVEDVVLDWEPVPGANRYDVQVSTDQNFNTIVDAKTGRDGVKSTRYSRPNTYNNDDYWWRVRARYDNDTSDEADDIVGLWGASDNGSVSEFRRAWPDQPTLQYPLDQVSPAVADPLFYQWTPVDHASHYELDVSPNISFTPGTYKTCVTRHTTYTPRGDDGDFGIDRCSVASGTWYWRVRAVDSHDHGTAVNGEYSATSRFVYDPGQVALTAPADGATVEVPTLRWQPSSYAEKYKVTIVDSVGHSTSATTSALSYTPARALHLDHPSDVFRWTVQAVAADGQLSPMLTLGNQRTFTLTAVSGGGAIPTLQSPADGAAFTRFPSVSWSPVTGAGYYQVCIGTEGTGLCSYLASENGGKYFYPAVTDLGTTYLDPGTYEFFVEAYTASGGFISDGPSRSFTIEQLGDVSGERLALSGQGVDNSAQNCTATLGPPATTPAVCADLRATPVLGWDPIPNAGRYYVYLSADRELTNLIATYQTESTMLVPTQTLPDSQAGDAYYWYVRACKGDGVCDVVPADHPADHVFDKRSLPVQLLSPVEGATVANELTLRWRDQLETNQADTPTTGPASTVEAREYRVQISADPTFASVLDNVVVDQTTYTAYTRTFPEGPLYWRVQTIDGSENALAWSVVRSVDKSSPAPVLTAPAEGSAQDRTPFFTWRAQAFAERYEIEVYDDNDRLATPSNLVLGATTKHAAWGPDETLAPATAPYVWRVRRLDVDNRPGPWSSWRSFTVKRTAPQLVSPGNNRYVDGRNPLFVWEAVPDAASYLYERAAIGTGSDETVRTVSLAWAPTRVLEDGRYQWRVAARDAADKPIGTSPWRQFTVDGTAPTVVGHSPGRTAKPDASFTVRFSEPVVGVDRTTLKLFRKGSPDPVSASIVMADGDRKAVLDPTRSLQVGATYTLKLLTGVTDRAGNPVPPRQWSTRITR